MRTFSEFKRGLVALGAVLVLALSALPSVAQANLPPTWVFARAYAGWNIVGQQANTYTFNGGVCNYTPYTNGNSPSFFDFSGYQGASKVYNPVLITDANPALSEIVTPTSTVQTSSSCGFAASTANSHTSFVLSSGTVGLQEAITNQMQQVVPGNVILDQYWFTQVRALPTNPLPQTLITTATGNTSVAIVDTTTSPWMYWRWNGTAYAATSYSGGTSAPTAAAGAAAGTSPTGPTNTGNGNSMTVALTTGSATTTGTLFTETYANTAFKYIPVCSVWNYGVNTVGITYAVTWSTDHAVLTVTAPVAPVAATAYAFKIYCQ